MLRVGIVAGEASGDLLAADLIHACQQIMPEIQFEGIGGPQMEAAGCTVLFPSEKLSVMGLVEVVGRYYELASIRRRLIRHYLSNPPDIFIGVDAPDFNLAIEQRLHNAGVKTVHYVGPTVWAWRSGRIKKIKNAVDLMLVLFPFEVPIYEHHNINVMCTGHPATGEMLSRKDKLVLKEKLGLEPQKQVIAFMPGSRKAEIDRLLPVQLQVIERINNEHPAVQFVTNVLNKNTFDRVEQKISEMLGERQNINIKILTGRSKEVLTIADIGLLTSGTITLEALMCQLPMVVMYKMNWLSYRIIRSMANIQYASLPNLLAEKQIVPEFLQDECNPEKIIPVLSGLLNDDTRQSQLNEFDVIKRQLKQIDKNTLAKEILDLAS